MIATVSDSRVPPDYPSPPASLPAGGQSVGGRL